MAGGLLSAESAVQEGFKEPETFRSKCQKEGWGEDLSCRTEGTVHLLHYFMATGVTSLCHSEAQGVFRSLPLCHLLRWDGRDKEPLTEA